MVEHLHADRKKHCYGFRKGRPMSLYVFRVCRRGSRVAGLEGRGFGLGKEYRHGIRWMGTTASELKNLEFNAWRLFYLLLLATCSGLAY